MLRAVRIATSAGVAVVLAVVLATRDSNGLSAQVVAQAVPVLFEQAEAGPSLMVPSGARVRRRTARLNQTLLDSIAGTSPTAPVMTLNLFPNVVYTAILDDVEDTNPGRAWKGSLEGEPLSSVVLAVVDGVIAGHVSVPGALYEIRGDEDGTAVIAELDPSALRPPGPARVPPPGATEPVGAPRIAGAQTTINVAFFYTPGARRDVGSTAQMQAAIAAAVAQANQVYDKTGIKLQIKVVFVGQINYRATGDIFTDLDRLTETKDRRMDAVHGRRNRTKADLVHLVIAPDPLFCGLAWVIDSIRPDLGFGITSSDCLTNFTVVHELGHNMGGTHDWFVDSDPGAFPYSHGYVDIKRRFIPSWRTAALASPRA